MKNWKNYAIGFVSLLLGGITGLSIISFTNDPMLWVQEYFPAIIAGLLTVFAGWLAFDQARQNNQFVKSELRQKNLLFAANAAQEQVKILVNINTLLELLETSHHQELNKHTIPDVLRILDPDKIDFHGGSKGFHSKQANFIMSKYSSCFKQVSTLGTELINNLLYIDNSKVQTSRKVINILSHIASANRQADLSPLNIRLKHIIDMFTKTEYEAMFTHLRTNINKAKTEAVKLSDDFKAKHDKIIGETIS